MAESSTPSSAGLAKHTRLAEPDALVRRGASGSREGVASADMAGMLAGRTLFSPTAARIGTITYRRNRAPDNHSVIVAKS